MDAGDIIFLTPRSHHGKNRLAEHGQWWECLRTAMRVACKPGQKSAGLLKSLQTGDIRWVAELDPDFEARVDVLKTEERKNAK
jgi:hypothetical protein